MLNVGLIGYGNMARSHGQLLDKHEGVRLVAVADARSERREMAAADHEGITLYEDGRDLIARESCQVIFVCCPTFLHTEMTIRALEAGRDVFCEKPMGLSVDQCDQMIEAERRTDRTLMIGQVLRFWPEYVYLKDTLDSGRLGKLNALSMMRVGGVSVGWDNWYLDEERGGMQIFDRHIHDTDAILWMLGKPQAVQAFGVSRDPRTEGGIYHSFTQYLFPDVIVNAEGSADAPKGFPFTARYRAAFENGVLDFDSTRQTTLMEYANGEARAAELPKPMEALTSGLNISASSPYYNEQVYFFGCLREGKRPTRVTPADARETIRVIKAEIESARSGRPVEL